MASNPLDNMPTTPVEEKIPVASYSPSSSGSSSGASLLVDIMCGSKETEDEEVDSDEWDKPETENISDLDERSEMVRYLRASGYAKFLEKYLIEEELPVRSILKKLGINLPSALEEFEDIDLLPLLKEVLKREVARRIKLPHFNTFEDVVNLLKKAKNVVVLVGAGISTSLGILDFRSDNGFYARLARHGLSEPSEMFDIHTFRENPEIFYTFARDLLPETNHYSPSHAFIRLLEKKNKLSTLFTQNIDNLEKKTGLSDNKIIQCHGSFATATCIKCKHKVDGSELYEDIRNQRVSYCNECGKPPLKLRRVGQNKKEKHYFSDGDSESSEDDLAQPGIMKPDITFFGEALPDSFFNKVGSGELEETDLLICIGTSLKVAPVSELISVIPPTTPQIYISRTPVRHTQFDVNFLSPYCDWVIVEICKRAGWLNELQALCDLPECHSGSKTRAFETDLDIKFEEPSTYHITSTTNGSC
ncbi:NAD-dependent histone deacetylase sir2 [Schizosaccharomyces pombe]